MKDASLLGIAELIESRDGSTGGHVKRTSNVVSILTKALIENHTYDVSPYFYAIVEKARNIILDGMGSQFDPALKDVFCECLPQLEEYYEKNPQ